MKNELSNLLRLCGESPALLFGHFCQRQRSAWKKDMKDEKGVSVRQGRGEVEGKEEEAAPFFLP